MAQHDYVLDNQSGAEFRQDLNNALSAIVSQNSGATEPSTTYAYMLWADTSTSQLKQRNAANTDWVVLQELDGTLLMESGTASDPGLAFASDKNTGIYRVGADQIGISTGGASALVVDASQRVGVGTSSPSRLFHVSGTTDTPAQFQTSQSNLYIQLANSSASNGYIGFEGTNLSLWNNGANRLNIDSSGNVGIGTTGPTSVLDINTSSGGSQLRFSNGTYYGYVGIDSAFAGNDYAAPSGGHRFRVGGSFTEAARIDSSGRLLVGTSTNATTALLQVRGDSAAATNPGTLYLFPNYAPASLGTGDVLGRLQAGANDGSVGATIDFVGDASWGSGDYPTRLVFSTTSDSASSPTERLRIDSTGRISGSTGGLEITRNVDSAAALGSFISSSATTANQYGLYVRLDGDPNNTSQYFLECFGGVSTRRATIRSNGGLANYQSNNVDLSDERTKRDIASAPSTWDCVQSWNVVNYNYLDDAQDESARIGVIAQQVQQHCPEVVVPYQENQNAVVDDEGNIVTPAIEQRLGVREQQMMWMAIKALQEAQLRIETLEAEIAALKAS